MTGWHFLRGALLWLVVPAWSVGACGGTVRNGGETSAGGTDQGGPSTRGGGVSTQPPVGVSGTRAAGGTGPSEMAAGGEPGAVMLPGTSDRSITIECGVAMCKSVKTLAPSVFVDPCCVDGACGVNTAFFGALGASFKDMCQAVGQEGSVDAGCPNSAGQMLTVQGIAVSVPGFVGCCRAETATCGVVVDSVPVSGFPLPFASPMLGCVDSAPFFGNKQGAFCGTAGAGSGGADSSGAGAPSSAGAPSGGGETSASGAGGAG